MQKAIKHMLAVLGRILFLGLSLQMVLGLLWICCNFGKFQEFGDSLFYLEVSKSMLCDEYTGALYPVLLMLVRGIEGILRIPYTYVMHLLQLGAAVYAGYFFLRALGVRGRFFSVWGSLCLLTFPMAAQCHLAILPNSLVFSALLMELAFVFEAVKAEEPLRPRRLFPVNLFWLLQTFLLPDYFYLGMVPVLLLLLYDLCKYRKTLGKRSFNNIVLFAAFAGMIVSIGALVQKGGSYGRPEKTVEAALFSRLTWTSLCRYYEEWPQDMREACPYGVVLETSFYADNMERMLQPLMEENLGKERTHELYREVAGYVWTRNKGRILHEMAWDAVGYTLPPVTMQLMLSGRGYDSYVGRNYEIMKQEAPVLTRYYVDYSSWWFLAGILLAFAMEISLLLYGTLRGQRGRIFPAVICLTMSGISVLWYTLRGAGMWDYKNALFAGAMWLIWMICRGYQCINEEKTNGE